MKNQILISCIIIGYNSKKNLEKLLESINQQKYSEKNIEIIYIDDGSNDDSINLFNSYPLKFVKHSFSMQKNSGRMQSRLKGIQHVKGTWSLFLNSNVILKNNIFSEYLNSIKSIFPAIGYAGKIQYESQDKAFESYLNNKNRGINNLSHLSVVPFYNVLFSNCIIKTDAIKEINWKKNFSKYGGEELDFSHLLYSQNSTKILFYKSAIIYRKNHPGYYNHCNRLLEFGKYNFQELDRKLQLRVIKSKLFLKKNIFNYLIILSIVRILMFMYKIKIRTWNKLIIKLSFWGFIMLGHQKSK